jgi:26S proteasome regulatory subunit N10
MVLEATIICIDNSDWTRNGDYLPTRYQAQVDSAREIIQNRCENNPENSLGIMAMAGKRVEMEATLTNDESRLLNAMYNIPLSGECDITSALSIAILCLKHRINKNQKQRIILFVGSPVTTKAENLVQIGKKLKKYNVAIDIISFGNIDENRELLNVLLKEVNNSDNSSILEVPLGAYLMDSLFSSPIMGFGNNADAGMGGAGAGANPGAGQQEPIGLSQFERDMNLALQMSLQEAQKNENKDKTPNINAEAEKSKNLQVINEDEEEENELENARLLSIQENNKIIQKENEDKEKKAANEILESKDFLDDLLNQVDEEDVDKKEEDKKKDEKKEDKKEDNKEDKKDEKDKKNDDKMDVEK